MTSRITSYFGATPGTAAREAGRSSPEAEQAGGGGHQGATMGGEGLNPTTGPQKSADEPQVRGKGPNRWFVGALVAMMTALYHIKRGRGSSDAIRSNIPWPGISVRPIFEPSDPILKYHESKSHQALDPAGFYERPVIVWAPELFFPMAMDGSPPCPDCKNKAPTHKGWIDQAVDVIDVGRVLQVISRRYETRRRLCIQWLLHRVFKVNSSPIQVIVTEIHICVYLVYVPGMSAPTRSAGASTPATPQR